MLHIASPFVHFTTDGAMTATAPRPGDGLADDPQWGEWLNAPPPEPDDDGAADPDYWDPQLVRRRRTVAFAVADSEPATDPVPLREPYFDGIRHHLAEPYQDVRADPNFEPAELTAVGGQLVSWRTLADVPDDPPSPLRFGMLEPDGPTLLYAAPGVGKGCTGAYLCVEAQEAGLLPLVYDAERRPREWARRVSGLGGDRSRVIYIEPGDLPPSLAGRAFWDVAPYLATIAKQAGANLIMVDSILPATGLAEDRLKSDPSVPFRYVAALDALGIPSLSFGHPPKGQPEGEPFGSFAWLAAFRLTWLGTKAEGEGHHVRWRPRKRNERGHIPGVLLTFAYGDDNRLCGVEREDDEQSTRDAILAALVSGPRSVADLAEEITEQMEDAAPGEGDRIRERLSRALRRMAREGWVERIGGAGGRNVRWGLRLRDDRP